MRIRKCTMCGCKFESKGAAQYCGPCKKKKRVEDNRAMYKELYGFKAEEQREYSPKEGIEAIGRVVCSVERYNRKHGTSLSCGKYVMLMGL